MQKAREQVKADYCGIEKINTPTKKNITVCWRKNPNASAVLYIHSEANIWARYSQLYFTAILCLFCYVRQCFPYHMLEGRPTPPTGPPRLPE